VVRQILGGDETVSEPIGESRGGEYCALEYSWAYNREASCKIHGTLFNCYETLKVKIRRVEALAATFEENSHGGQPIVGYETTKLMRDGTGGISWHDAADRIRQAIAGVP
jgi:hypothetical protein